MQANSSAITLSRNYLSKSQEQRVDNYIKGLELESLTHKVLDEYFNLKCKRHFVTEPGPDVEFSNGVMEIVNCKPYLTVSEPRFRRILKNLRGKRIKAIVCSYQKIFTEKQQKTLRRKRITIIEVGTQILPSYIWKNYPVEKRLGTKKNSKRNLKWVKNRILSGLLKIKELFLFYSYRRIISDRRRILKRCRINNRLLESILQTRMYVARSMIDIILPGIFSKIHIKLLS